MKSNRAFRVIGWATLIAGTLDFLYASVRIYSSGKSVVWLWQYVASGILGQQAFSLGVPGMLCGVLCHFLIMGLFSGFIYLVHSKISAIDSWPIIVGVVYGIGMWLVMNLLVVPLSRAGHGLVPLKLDMMMNLGFIMHLVLGVVIVLAIRQGMRRHPSRG